MDTLFSGVGSLFDGIILLVSTRGLVPSLVDKSVPLWPAFSVGTAFSISLPTG